MILSERSFRYLPTQRNIQNALCKEKCRFIHNSLNVQWLTLFQIKCLNRNQTSNTIQQYILKYQEEKARVPKYADHVYAGSKTEKERKKDFQKNTNVILLLW